MSELLGLLDSLEATILEGKKIPFSEKMLLDEKRLLNILDKIRLVIKSDGNVIKKALGSNIEVKIERKELSQQTAINLDQEVLRDAREKAEKLKVGANEYSDFVLANIQMMLSKMQKNFVTLEKNLESGRAMIQQAQNEDEKNNHEEREIDEISQDYPRNEDELYAHQYKTPR